MSDILGGLFARVAALRVAAYRGGWLRQARLAGPVVSIGNLSLGGSGKTPVVRRVAELLSAAGERVAILSRGYRGSFRGDALVVSDGASVLASSAQAGDEPVMLARALPGVVVAVGPRRDVVGRMVERRFGPRVFVLDDGFQHLRLARDLDVVCLDVRDLAGRTLPLGRLREGPAALARKDGAVVAFANVWTSACKAELSVDLMRHGPEAPRGTMDHLFVSLMLWGREQGYQAFNLGMAPFSGLEARALAPLWTKLGARLFRYGEDLYNFQGLRQYKEKFAPEWRPRWLAAPGGLRLPMVLTNIAALVSRGLKGVVAR